MLDALKQQRQAKAGELSEIMEAQARLRAAMDRETAALRAIGELGAKEAATMSAWARGGCVGDPPRLDMAERTKLAAELAQAQAQSEAARNVELDLGDKQRALSIEMSTLGMRIEDVAIEQLVVRHETEMRNLDESSPGICGPAWACISACTAC